MHPVVMKSRLREIEKIRVVENSTAGRKVDEKDTLSKSRELAVQIVYLFEL